MPSPSSRAFRHAALRWLATAEAWGAIASAAIAVPALLAFNAPPSATFINQAAAFAGWSALLFALIPSLTGSCLARAGGESALLGALALVALAALGSAVFDGLPAALTASSFATILAAGFTAHMGARCSRAGIGLRVFRAMCVGLVVAGVLSLVVALVQVFLPDWADGRLIAATSADGRASGNLRQPNHLSSLLLWSVIGLLWLHETGRLSRGVTAVVAAFFTFAIVLTASRTGVAGTVLLAVWGTLDRRLSRSTRTLLLLAPVAYAVFWSGFTAWSHLTHQALGAEARIADTAESPNSRIRIWANALTLIAQHPWLGVGFGEFNFAWSLHPFPQRPTAFFDHTHDLPLQLLVELGVPLGLLVLGLLGYALWRAFVASRAADARDASMLRAAFMIVLMIGIHSLLEYPLWYAYFLLPAAFAWGLCLGGAPAKAPAPASARVPRRATALAGAALLMLALSIYSVFDYMRVAAIFSADDPAPLAKRIADGERSWFFAHHAHYAAATISEHPAQVLPSFRIATHYLLDTRLMIAWANALHESGDDERARYVAARLREFRNEDSKTFFEPCDEPHAAGEPVPFQCTAPTGRFDYRDFR
ncbi:MAG: Wzy polymerase domain-containing protein [Rhizobacter sp.]